MLFLVVLYYAINHRTEWMTAESLSELWRNVTPVVLERIVYVLLQRLTQHLYNRLYKHIIDQLNNNK